MATTTTKKINDLTEGFGDVNERYRVFNEKLIETGKKTGSAALDSYEKTVASYVDYPAAARRRHPARLGDHRRQGAERLHHRGHRGVHLCRSGRPEVKPYARAVTTQQSADDQLRLGEIIRRQRELAELSMRQVAAMAGISNPYLSQIERGLRAPSEEVLRAIAESLNVSADLLRGDEPAGCVGRGH